jgi:hypothetical protein
MRSIYLARTLLARARALEGGLAEDRASGAEVRERLRDLVAKVLVVEEGIVEEAKIRFVLDALPSRSSGRATSDRELRDLAASLETGLWR